ncbi:MAG: redoxin domain-containing protein, partial [Candidatus Binatia bacterium]
MSKRSLSIVAALVVLAACAGPTLAELAVGQPAPDFKLSDLDGREVSLASLRGKTVVLEWINPNCPVSRRHAEAKTMTSTAAKHAEVVWLAINSTNRSHGDFVAAADHKKYNADHGIAYPVLDDSSGEVGRAYGAATTPHMYVIDGAGKLAYVGAIDDSPRGGNASVNYVDSALGALASGKTPQPASTKAYGCSVKY